MKPNRFSSLNHFTVPVGMLPVPSYGSWVVWWPGSVAIRQSGRHAACRPKQLLQPSRGFERLRTGPVFASPRDLSVADREDDPEGRIRLDSAELGAPTEPEDPDDRVSAGIDQLDRLDPEVVEGV